MGNIFRSDLDLLNSMITLSGVSVKYDSTNDALNAIADNSGISPALRVTSVQGLAGSSGSSGTSGNAGSSGSSGSSGTSAPGLTSGTSGSSGVSGTSGSSGISGTSGSSGISGTSGTSGTSGSSGTSGTVGPAGPSFTGGTVSDLTVTGNLLTNSSTVYYVGDPTADGTWRFQVSANNLVFENYTLSATTWVTMGTFLG